MMKAVMIMTEIVKSPPDRSQYFAMTMIAHETSTATSAPTVAGNGTVGQVKGSVTMPGVVGSGFIAASVLCRLCALVCPAPPLLPACPGAADHQSGNRAAACHRAGCAEC